MQCFVWDPCQFSQYWFPCNVYFSVGWFGQKPYFKKMRHITRWLGLRMPEIPFLRTLILKISQGRMPMEPSTGDCCFPYLKPPFPKSCIHPSNCIIHHCYGKYEFGIWLDLTLNGWMVCFYKMVVKWNLEFENPVLSCHCFGIDCGFQHK